MAEPIGSKTFKDLVTSVARFAGLAYYGASGDEEAMVPIDRHDRIVCQRIVNDGIRRFIGDAPPNGWRWQQRINYTTLKVKTEGTASSGSATTLVDSTYADVYADDYYNDCIIEIIGGKGIGEHALVTDFTGLTCTFTFSALSGGSTPDSTSEFVVGHRYILPQDFGGDISGPIRYIRDSNRGRRIDWAHYAEIAVLRENVAHTGYPYLAAIKPYGDRRWEINVYPDSQTDEVIEFPYLKYFNEMELTSGVATTGGATSIIDTVLADEFVNDYFVDGIITIISGIGKGGYATITDYVQSTKTVSFSGGLNNGVTTTDASIYVIEKDLRFHPAGHAFDTFIESACLAEAEQQLEDVFAGWGERYESKDIYKAYNKDGRAAPRKLGKMTNGKSARVIKRVWEDVTYN
jgi:hypothetical protein